MLLCLVVGISDGDTLTARCDGIQEQVKVRLAEIDAPEKKQPWGGRSKQALSEMCFMKKAELRVVTRDRYGRTVATVVCDGTNANREQVRRGMAWVYDKYVKDASLYDVQREAMGARLGLWHDTVPVSPWEWRKGRKLRTKLSSSINK